MILLYLVLLSIALVPLFVYTKMYTVRFQLNHFNLFSGLVGAILVYYSVTTLQGIAWFVGGVAGTMCLSIGARLDNKEQNEINDSSEVVG